MDASLAPSVAFEETSAASGIAHRWTPPGTPPLNILQTIGNGVALLDQDGDGNLDLLCVGPKPALYRGDGKGGFTDATQSSGLAKIKGYFLGCATGDIDNDGQTDVVLTGYGEGRLLRGDAGSLVDITPGSGIPRLRWGTSAAFADVDADGDLDLYIGNYAEFGPKTVPQLCLAHGIRTSCGPKEYKPVKGVLLLGDGKGRFADVTKAWNAADISGKTLGVAFADIDGSGRPSLMLANDEMPGDLLHNLGGRFDNIASVAGVAYDAAGNLHGGMGTDWGDVDGDGRLDVFVATYQNEVKNLYRNGGDLIFTDRSAESGLAPVVPMVSFGSKFVDIDNDGDLDLAVANGHVQDNIDKVDRSTTYRQPTQLFVNDGKGNFADVSKALGAKGQTPIVGRGLATGDLDNDGLVDLVVVDSDGHPLVLRNRTQGAGHWIGVDFRQPKRGPRDATGVRIEATVRGRRIVRHVHTDGSYLSASDRRMVIGLGSATRAESIAVTWSDGTKETLPEVAADRYWIVERGSAPR